MISYCATLHTIRCTDQQLDFRFDCASNAAMLSVMEDLNRYRWIAVHILPHQPELRSWLRRRLGSLRDNDVDDLLQEAFARIWEADSTTVRNGRAYLYTTVRHLLTEYGRRSRIVPIERLEEIDSLRIISDEPGLDRRVGARQELERLRAIVAALPVQCRRVFELRKFEDWSQREVAMHMGLSEKTVENHLTRALARITEMLSACTLPGKFDNARLPPRAAADSDRGID